MAIIDIKEATIKMFDGTLGVLTLDSTAPEADLLFTAKSTHIGTDNIGITFTDPAANDALLIVTVDGREIDVSLATGVAGAITSIASEIQAGIVASPAANALVTVTFAGGDDGTGIVDAFAKGTLDGQKSITVKIGEGNFTYNEVKNRVFTLDRGNLDTVKNDDDEPMGISMDATWEWITAETGATPTLEDVLKKRGEAAAWVSTAADDCQPYCVDIELYNAPSCSVTDQELLTFEEYYYETLDHDLREGTISTAGRCNRLEAVARRVAVADIIDA